LYAPTFQFTPLNPTLFPTPSPLLDDQLSSLIKHTNRQTDDSYTEKKIAESKKQTYTFFA